MLDMAQYVVVISSDTTTICGNSLFCQYGGKIQNLARIAHVLP